MSFSFASLSFARGRYRIWLAIGCVALAAVAAFSAASGGAATKNASRTSATPDIIVVSGPDADPFFAALKKGVTDGGRQLGVRVQYTTVTNFQNLAADLARLLQQAISRHPRAIVIGNFFPSANEQLIRQARRKGIPVFVHNAGGPEALKAGALFYVGEDPALMGAKAGQLEAAAGVKRGLCVIHVPGNPNLTARCNGYIAALKKAGGSGKTITVPAGASAPDTVAAIKGALSADAAVTGIFTLGSAQALNAIDAVTQTRPGVKVGTTDLSSADLQAVKDGSLLFAIDQQPYLQGFYSIEAAAHYLKFGLLPVSSIITGPLAITKANAAQVLEINKKYRGIRGAS